MRALRNRKSGENPGKAAERRAFLQGFQADTGKDAFFLLLFARKSDIIKLLLKKKSRNPGVAQLVGRHIWECRGGIRDGTRRNAAKPCDTCVCRIFPDCRKRHKSGFDHRNDHRQKNL